jgi:hypothetical protein
MTRVAIVVILMLVGCSVSPKECADMCHGSVAYWDGNRCICNQCPAPSGSAR